MRGREQGPAPDVFEAFADRVEDPDVEGSADAEGSSSRVAAVARSAGLTLALMVVTSLGILGGGWWATDHVPDVEYASVIWEGVVLLVWGLVGGIFGGAAALAVGFVVVGLPWLRRRQRDGR